MVMFSHGLIRVSCLTCCACVCPPPPAGDSKGIEDMDMNTVRLCFQCELEWDDGRKDNLSPVVSNPIYDKSEASPRALPGITHTSKIIHLLFLFFFHRAFAYRGHDHLAVEDQLPEPVQGLVRRPDGDLHVVRQGAER